MVVSRSVQDQWLDIRGREPSRRAAVHHSVSPASLCVEADGDDVPALQREAAAAVLRGLEEVATSQGVVHERAPVAVGILIRCIRNGPFIFAIFRAALVQPAPNETLDDIVVVLACVAARGGRFLLNAVQLHFQTLWFVLALPLVRRRPALVGIPEQFSAAVQLHLCFLILFVLLDLPIIRPQLSLAGMLKQHMEEMNLVVKLLVVVFEISPPVVILHTVRRSEASPSDVLDEKPVEGVGDLHCPAHDHPRVQQEGPKRLLIRILPEVQEPLDDVGPPVVGPNRRARPMPAYLHNGRGRRNAEYVQGRRTGYSELLGQEHGEHQDAAGSVASIRLAGNLRIAGARSSQGGVLGVMHPLRQELAVVQRLGECHHAQCEHR
mmetsp:Transcript_5135/g.14155  ORF Transcript_5135/g.14155 Transcript_5135/m.14155 type:complete len:379 (+) Transcript_5135:1-1137(+)